MWYPISFENLCINCGYDRSFHEDEMGRLHKCTPFRTVADLIADLAITRERLVEAEEERDELSDDVGEMVNSALALFERIGIRIQPVYMSKKSTAEGVK